MQSIMVDKRFCGPPNSANGGYVCGLLAAYIDGSAEITLRAPPPLNRQLGIVAGADGGVELRDDEITVATGRAVCLADPEIPACLSDVPRTPLPRDSVFSRRCPESHPCPRDFVQPTYSC